MCVVVRYYWLKVAKCTPIEVWSEIDGCGVKLEMMTRFIDGRC